MPPNARCTPHQLTPVTVSTVTGHQGERHTSHPQRPAHRTLDRMRQIYRMRQLATAPPPITG